MAWSSDVDGGMWQVVVEVPIRIGNRDSLFDAVADAVHAWEPDERDGWDSDARGEPVPEPAPDPSWIQFESIRAVRWMVDAAVDLVVVLTSGVVIVAALWCVALSVVGAV